MLRNSCPGRRRRGLVPALAGALLLAAGSAPAAAALTLDFVMPNTPAPYLLPFFVAQDLGWYKADGLTVGEKVVTGDVNSMRGLIAGDATVTYLGSGTIMQAYVTGAKVKVLGSWQQIADYRIVARTAFTSLKDLAEKRWASVGAGSMTQAIPEMMLEKHGLDYHKAQFLGVGGLAARYQALLGGTVDATILDTYFSMLAVKSGKAHIVASVPEDFPGLGYNYIVARQATLADPAQHEALAIFVRDGIRGIRFVIDRPSEAAEILDKRLKQNDAETMAATLRDMTALGVWGSNGGLDRPVFDFTEDFYRKVGILTGHVTYDQLVEPSLVEAALATLGRR